MFLQKKGHTFKISVMAVDQVGNPVNAVIRSFVITDKQNKELAISAQN